MTSLPSSSRLNGAGRSRFIDPPPLSSWSLIVHGQHRAIDASWQPWWRSECHATCAMILCWVHTCAKLATACAMTICSTSGRSRAVSAPARAAAPSLAAVHGWGHSRAGARQPGERCPGYLPHPPRGYPVTAGATSRRSLRFVELMERVSLLDRASSRDSGRLCPTRGGLL